MTFDWEESFHRNLTEACKEEAANTGVDSDDWFVSGKASKKWPKGQDLNWWRHEGTDIAKSYGTWREEHSDWEIWTTPDGRKAIELELNVYFGPFLVRMFIDRIFDVNQLVIPTDMKSGAKLPDSDLQLGMYACGIEAAYGIRPRFGCFFDHRKGVLTNPRSLDKYTIPYMVGLLQQFDRAKKAGVFLPYETNMCRVCSVRNACYAVGGRESRKYDRADPSFFS